MLEGVTAVNESRLRAVLATEESPWLPWGETRLFDRSEFETDLRRIEAFYADHGYPDARVSSFDVDLIENGRAVDLRIVIEEGAPVRIQEIVLAGFDVLSDAAVADLRADLPQSEGQPLARPSVLAGVTLATNVVKDHGYAYATVDAVDIELALRERRVVFTATPGTQAYFGPIEIGGNASVDDEIIRRQLLYRPGELFKRSLVQESQRQLFGLPLFEFASIDVIGGESQPAEVPTRVTVAEGEHRQVEFSFGYGTEEKLRAEARWTHANFLGGARAASVHGKWSWIDRGIEGELVQPYLLWPAFSLSLNGHAWYADEPAFTVLSRGGRATVRYVPTARTSASLAFVNEFESSRISREALADLELRDELIALGLNPITGEQTGTLAALSVQILRQTAVNVLDPQQGYLASVQLEQAGGVLPGSFNYYNVMGEGRHYFTAGAQVTFAQRVRYGSITPMGPDSDVPFFKRYFLVEYEMTDWLRLQSEVSRGDVGAAGSLFHRTERGGINLLFRFRY